MPDILASAKQDPKLLPPYEEVPDIPDLPFRHGGTAPSEPIPQEPPPPPIVHPVRRSRSIGVLSAVLLLFVTLPLSVYFVSQQRELTDQRSRAAYVTAAGQLYIANLDKTSFSVIWKESTPAKGCATAKNTKSKKETKLCDDSLSRIHLITLSNLDQYSPYEVSAQGGQNIQLHPFFGGTILTGLFDKNKPSPQRVQGKVVNTNNQPLNNAFVVITPFLTDRFYFPVADSTDQNGMYAVDLSLIKAQIAKQVETYIVEVIDLQGKTLIEQKVSAPSGNQMPVVTVTP